MDPTTLFATGSSVLGKVATPGGPSYATGGGVGGSSSDNSGWNVNFGSGTIDSNRSNPMQGYMPYLLVGAVVLVAIAWLKKKG